MLGYSFYFVCSHFPLQTITSPVFFLLFLLIVDEDDVFSFIQISDTHLSHLPTSMTHINFRIFASTVVPAINPDIVIHTGDITDGWIEGLKSTFSVSLILIFQVAILLKNGKCTNLPLSNMGISTTHSGSIFEETTIIRTSKAAFATATTTTAPVDTRDPYSTRSIPDHSAAIVSSVSTQR